MASTPTQPSDTASPQVIESLRGLIDARAVYDALRDLGLIHKPGPKSTKPKETVALKMVRALVDAVDNGKATARVTAAARLQAMIERVTMPDGSFAGGRDDRDGFDDPRSVSAVEAARQTRAMLFGPREQPPTV